MWKQKDRPKSKEVPEKPKWEKLWQRPGHIRRGFAIGRKNEEEERPVCVHSVFTQLCSSVLRVLALAMGWRFGNSHFSMNEHTGVPVHFPSPPVALPIRPWITDGADPTQPFPGFAFKMVWTPCSSCSKRAGHSVLFRLHCKYVFSNYPRKQGEYWEHCCFTAFLAIKYEKNLTNIQSGL